MAAAGERCSEVGGVGESEDGAGAGGAGAGAASAAAKEGPHTLGLPQLHTSGWMLLGVRSWVGGEPEGGHVCGVHERRYEIQVVCNSSKTQEV